MLQLGCRELLRQKLRPLECVPAISPPAKHEALTWTGSAQQFPVTTGLPTKQEQPFQHCIQIPDQIVEQGSLIDLIFLDGLPEDQIASRVILTPRNDTSLTINQQILQRQVGDVTTYFAADHAEVPDNPDEANNYPQEFLHNLHHLGCHHILWS